jgi:hypothetical protein
MARKRKSKPLRALLEEQLSETRKEIKRLQSKERLPYEDARLLQLRAHREEQKKALKRVDDGDE